MKPARWWALTGAAGLAVYMVATAGPAAASAHPGPAPTRMAPNRLAPNRLALAGSLTPARERAHPDGTVSAGSSVGFDLLLSLHNAPGAQAFLKAVSKPGSAQYHHYLTDKQWETRYGPTGASVAKAQTWLRQQGFTVGSVAKDGLYVSVTGTAQRVEHAFGVKLGYFKVNGARVRLAKGTLTIPSSLAGVVSGAVGVNQYVATPALTTGASQAAQAARAAGQVTQAAKEPGPPAGFRNPQPCSAYWGQKTDTADSGQLYKPYTHPLPYDICGYQPAQLRGAYGLTGASGQNGKGVKIAIVDAYDSPTLQADTQEYFKVNDPAHPLNSSQFVNSEPSKINNLAACGGNGWYAEQALDVESSHAMAPGATIEYVGGVNCLNNGLLDADTTAVTSGASVVTNSWDDVTGDVFTDAATRTAFDDTFMLAGSTGVTVLFCSHDDGDNFADFGLTAQNYPATSPYVTAVGGTALEVNARDQRTAEYGWSTGKQVMCETSARNCGTATKPAGSMTFSSGGAGGTSYVYTEPYYQDKVVPSDLTLRNEAVNGPVPYRVVPDISMDGDAQTGMLIGLTQSFPNGSYYAQFKEGGTSLSSPLLAGVVADVDQAAGASLGFLNPALYQASTQTPTAFNDIVPPPSADAAATVRVDYLNAVNGHDGFIMSARALDYEGPETYCDPTGNCATRDVSLTTAPGFDSMTGLGSVGPQFISALSKF